MSYVEWKMGLSENPPQQGYPPPPPEKEWWEKGLDYLGNRLLPGQNQQQMPYQPPVQAKFTMEKLLLPGALVVGGVALLLILKKK